MIKQFVLRFPFWLPPGHQIAVPEVKNWTSGKLTFELTTRENRYAITAQPFDSEDDARAFASKLWAALCWLTLRNDVPILAESKVRMPAYAEDPKKAAKYLGLAVDHVDGLADGSHPCVYPIKSEIRIAEMGSPNLVLINQPDPLIERIRESLSFPSPERAIQDDQLALALDLYSAYSVESSGNAKLFTLAMALEAMSGQAERAPHALELIDQWQVDTQARRDATTPDAKERDDYERLLSTLGWLRNEGIAQRIRTLVSTSLHRMGDPEAEDLGKKAGIIYNKSRSKLAHEGYLDPQALGQAVSALRGIVQKVLVSRFRELAT